MKNIKLILLALMAVFVFAQCEEDEKNSEPKGFEVTVNGDQWKTKQVIATVGEKVINMVATGEDGSHMYIVLGGGGASNYTLEKDSENSVTLEFEGKSPFTSNREASEGGEVKIEEIDEEAKNVSGTFKFVLANAKGDKLSVEGTITNLAYQGI